MHTPILAPAPLAITLPITADVGMCCAMCMDTLTPDGACLNVGACTDADSHATRRAPGETLTSRRQPMAFTIRGNVD